MLKDEILNSLVKKGGNVAQFLSFSPDGKLRFAWIADISEQLTQSSLPESLETLLARSEAGTINIRTFLPEKPDGNPFKYGLATTAEAETLVLKFMADGYYIIVNETIRVNDGGFSAVVFGDLMEGAPNDIPRCVEKPGCMRLSRSLGFEFIHAVYGFHFHMPYRKVDRVEFSVHPHRVGYLGDRYIIWQADEYDKASLPVAPEIAWPNKMSAAMGDKAFGLLIAYLMGLPVPHTTVFGRLIPQFHFGSKTHNDEPVWVRTVPKEQTPGKFQTIRGWKDPFAIMQEDDPDNTQIAAILIQDGVRGQYSGSAITDLEGNLVLEGCGGYGDQFMTGQRPPEKLPQRIVSEVEFLFERVFDKLGPARFEWVFDGRQAWIVQLHRGKTETLKNIIYPGMPVSWLDFPVTTGLEKLRKLVREVADQNIGIRLRGDVGISSHFGDILRKAKVPSVQVTLDTIEKSV